MFARFLLALTVYTLGQPVFAKAVAEAEDVEKGIPVTSELVRNACGACHALDDANRLSRI